MLRICSEASRYEWAVFIDQGTSQLLAVAEGVCVPSCGAVSLVNAHIFFSDSYAQVLNTHERYTRR